MACAGNILVRVVDPNSLWGRITYFLNVPTAPRLVLLDAGMTAELTRQDQMNLVKFFRVSTCLLQDFKPPLPPSPPLYTPVLYDPCMLVNLDVGAYSKGAKCSQGYFMGFWSSFVKQNTLNVWHIAIAYKSNEASSA